MGSSSCSGGESTGAGEPRKSLPVLSLPSCLSAVYGLSEPKATAGHLGINPSSKNLSNLFWNHLYSDLSTLLWQCLLQATVWLCFHKKIFLEHLPVPHFTDLHHSPSKSPGQTLSTEKMIQIRLSLLSLFLQVVRSSGQWDVRAAQGRQGTDTSRGHREAQSLCYFVHNNLWYSLCFSDSCRTFFLMFPLNCNDSWVFFPYFSSCFCICIVKAVCPPWILLLLISRFHSLGKKCQGNTEDNVAPGSSPPQFCYNQIQD